MLTAIVIAPFTCGLAVIATDTSGPHPKVPTMPSCAAYRIAVAFPMPPKTRPLSFKPPITGGANAQGRVLAQQREAEKKPTEHLGRAAGFLRQMDEAPIMAAQFQAKLKGAP